MACGFAAGLLHGGLQDADTESDLSNDDRGKLEEAISELAEELLRRAGETEFPISSPEYFNKCKKNV